ncbi:hypothetical protein ACTFIW_006554 [Dictyostelium discoideum]
MDTSQDIVISDSNTADNVEVRSISPRVAAIFDDIYYFFYKEIDIEFTRYTDNKLISERMYGKRIDFFLSVLYITRNIIESYNNVELLKCFFKMLNHCSKPNENIENFLMKLFTYLHSDSILDNIEIIRALRDNKLKIRREAQDYLNQILDEFYKKPKEAEERDGDDGLPMEFVRQDTLSKLFREIYNDIRDLLPEPIQVRHLLSRNIDGTFKLKEVLFYEFDRVSEDHWFYDDGKQSNIYSPEENNNNRSNNNNNNNKNSVLLDVNDKDENNNNNNNDDEEEEEDDAGDADEEEDEEDDESDNNNKNSKKNSNNNKENNKNKKTKKSSSKSSQLSALWTDEECRSLIKAVMILGHRWSKIKEDYYSASKRKPSQLKDKMRSLRKRYGDIKNIAIAYFTKAEIIEIEKLAALSQQKEEAQKLAKEKIESLSNIKSTSNTSAASDRNKGKNQNNDSDEEVDSDNENSDTNNEDNENENESESESENEKEKRNKKNSAPPAPAPAPAPPKKLKPIEEEESDDESENDSEENSEENEYIIKQKRKPNQIKSSPKKLKTNQSVDKSEDVNQSHKSKLKSKPQRKVEEEEEEESEEEESEEEEEDDEDYESEEDKKKKKSKKTSSNQTSTHTTTTTTTRKSNTKPIVVSSEEDSSDEEEKRTITLSTKKSNQTPTTPTKKPSQTPTTPTKKPNQTPTTPTKKPNQTPTTPTKKPSQTPATTTKKPNQTPTTPTKKPSQTPTTPTKNSTNRPKPIEEEENEQEEQHEKNQNKPLKKRVSEDWSNSSDKTSNKRFKSPETLNKDSKENKKTTSNSRRK